MNTQEIYDNMGEVSIKNAVKYIVVTKLVVEFKMCRYKKEDRPGLKVWKRYYYETYQCSVQSCRGRCKKQYWVYSTNISYLYYIRLLNFNYFFIPEKNISKVGTKNFSSKRIIKE